MLNRIPMSRTGWYSRTMERWVDSTCAVCVRHAWLQAGSCRWFFWVVLCSHYLVLLGVKPSFGVIFLKNKYLVIKSVRSPADIGFCAASDCPLGMWFAGWRSSIEYRYESFQSQIDIVCPWHQINGGSMFRSIRYEMHRTATTNMKWWGYKTIVIII